MKTQSKKKLKGTRTKYTRKRKLSKKNTRKYINDVTDVHYKPLVPIFVIVYNRIWCLEKCLKSLEYTGQPVILLNNGSDYPPCIEWINKIRGRYEVIDMERVNNTIELYANIRNGVGIWKQKHGEQIDAYIITDPDIELENPKLPWIHTLLRCLQKHSGVVAVGPNLRTDDIPDYYPLKQKTLCDESKNHINNWFKWENVRIKHSRIDTTFAMYRKDYIKEGPEIKALRIDAPYCARHLDWYLHPKKLTHDQIHYFKASKDITHYGGYTLKKIIENKHHACKRTRKLSHRKRTRIHTLTNQHRHRKNIPKLTLPIKKNQYTRKRIAIKIANIHAQLIT